MSSARPRQTPLAWKRRWFRTENKTQLELFWDNSAEAAGALKQLEELKQGPPETKNRPGSGATRSGIKVKEFTADGMPQQAPESKGGAAMLSARTVSMGNARGALSERGHDCYATPPEAVEALLPVEILPKHIWEPAA